jgi:AcrR family transcriptional regulator
MPSAAQDRRQTLRDRLILIAEARIREGGLAALRARDLASEAGCAVGAIYNVFGDLSDLVQSVNALTFARLDQAIANAMAPDPQDPTDQLVTMARAYHHFAAENRRLWLALFDLDRAPGEDAPDWYLTEMGLLLGRIDPPIAALFPALPLQDRAVLSRALFSAVHGIVLLSLDKASAGVPADQVDTMTNLLLRQFTRQAPP